MLKHTATLLMVICSLSAASCQTKTNKHPDINRLAFVKNEANNKYKKNWNSDRLLGRVKNIIQFSYNGPAADTTAPDAETIEAFHYDINSNLIEYINRTNETLFTRTTYTYNTAGLWTAMSSESKYESFTNYNIFDNQSNLLEEGERHPDGSVSRKVVYEYDKYGGVTKMTAAGMVTEFKNTYDKDQLLVLQENFVNKQSEGKTIWKYDSIGHLIEKVEYNKAGEQVSKINTSFNRDDLPVRLAFIKKGYRDNINEYQYNTHGLEVRQDVYDTETKTMKKAYEFSYEFDQWQNWTKCIMYDADHEVAMTIIRVISYY